MNAKILLKKIDSQIDIENARPLTDFRNYTRDEMKKRGVVKGLNMAKDLVYAVKEEQRTKHEN